MCRDPVEVLDGDSIFRAYGLEFETAAERGALLRELIGILDLEGVLSRREREVYRKVGLL